MSKQGERMTSHVCTLLGQRAMRMKTRVSFATKKMLSVDVCSSRVRLRENDDCVFWRCDVDRSDIVVARVFLWKRRARSNNDVDGKTGQGGLIDVAACAERQRRAPRTPSNFYLNGTINNIIYQVHDFALNPNRTNVSTIISSLVISQGR